MIAYTVLFLAAAPALLGGILNRARRLNFYALVMLTGIIGAVRYEVGIDYGSYLEQISFYLRTGYSIFEPGFLLLVKFAYLLTADPLAAGVLTLSLCAIIISILCFVVVQRLAISPAFSLALFILLPTFYLSSFNAVRNWIGILLFLLAMTYVMEKRYILACIVLVISISFHKTALLIALLMPVLMRTPSLALFSMMGLSATAFIFSFDAVLPIFLSWLIGVIGLSPSYFGEVNHNNEINIFATLFQIISLALVICLYPRRCEKKIGLFINLSFIGAFVSLAPSFINTIDAALINRLSGYFTISIIFLIPEVAGSMTRGSNIALRLGVFFVSSLYFFFTLLGRGDSYSLLPFQIVFGTQIN